MRIITESLEASFIELHESSLKLSERIEFGGEKSPNQRSAVLLIRSAATVEQCFGGIRTRLWDDPFEWTLPETLDNRERVVEYLNEVRQTREAGFLMISDDRDMLKEIPAPELIQPLFRVILSTLITANNSFARALELEKTAS